MGSSADSTDVYCPEERSIGDDTPALAAVYVQILVFQNHKLNKIPHFLVLISFFVFFFSIILSFFGLLVLCGTVYEFRQEIKKSAQMKPKSESDHYDVIGKSKSENEYTSFNKAYVHDEPKTNGDISPQNGDISKQNGDISKQNGGGVIQNGNTNVELPAGYMHHKEDNQFNPSAIPNGNNAETDTNKFITVNIKPHPSTEATPHKTRDSKGLIYSKTTNKKIKKYIYQIEYFFFQIDEILYSPRHTRSYLEELFDHHQCPQTFVW